MTETTKAASKEAMEAARGLCPSADHKVNGDYVSAMTYEIPCICDEAAAALDAFAAPVVKNLVELTSAHITAVTESVALRARHENLVKALMYLRYRRNLVDSPTGKHWWTPDEAIQKAIAALAADAKAGDRNEHS